MPRERQWDQVEQRSRVPVHDFVLESLIDCLVSAIKTLSYEHHEIHEGVFFISSHVNVALGAGASLILGQTTPIENFRHCRFLTNAGGAAHIKVWEDVGFTGGGALVLYNSNRNAPDSPYTGLTDPTLAGGTIILQFTSASGSGPKAGGGPGGLFEEIIYKDDANYAIELINLTNGAIAASIVCGFYVKDVGVCP